MWEEMVDMTQKNSRKLSLLISIVVLCILNVTFSFSAQIVPLDPSSSTKLLCIADEDNLVTEAGLSFVFYQNGQQITLPSGNPLFDCNEMNCLPGDEIYCTVSTTEDTYKSSSAIVRNTPPNITDVQIATLDGQTDVIFNASTTVKCEGVFEDYDQEPLYVDIEWQKFDGSSFVRVAKGPTYQTYAAGDVIRCVFNVSDSQSWDAKADTISISSSMAKVVSWHVPYGELEATVTSVANQIGATRNIAIVPENSEFNYNAFVKCENGNCGDVEFTLLSDGVPVATDTYLNLNSPNPVSKNYNLNNFDASCFASTTPGAECESIWDFSSNDVISTIYKEVYAQACSTTFAPYVFCDSTASGTIAVIPIPPIDTCMNPQNVEVTADKNVLKPGESISLRVIASCDEGEIDVTNVATYNYDSDMFSRNDVTKPFEFIATTLCGTSLIMGSYGGLTDSVSLQVDCNPPEEELYYRACREMELQEWVQFRIKHHTRGWTKELENRLVQDMGQLANELKTELETNPQANRGKYVDFSSLGKGNILVPDRSKLDLRNFYDDPSKPNELLVDDDDGTLVSANTCAVESRMYTQPNSAEYSECEYDPIIDDYDEADQTSLLGSIALNGVSKTVVNPQHAINIPFSENYVRIPLTCGQGKRVNPDSISIEGAGTGIGNLRNFEIYCDFDEGNSEYVCELDNVNDDSILSPGVSICRDIDKLTYDCECDGEDELVVTQPPGVSSGLLANSGLSQAQSRACARADDPSICNDNGRSDYDKLLDRVARTGLVIEEDGDQLEPQFLSCIPDETDVCYLNGDGCCYKGQFFENGAQVWRDDYGKVYTDKPSNSDVPLFLMTCKVNSPGSWVGSGGAPVVCDASWHNICTEDGAIYETNLTYQADGTSGYFCAHNGTGWDWKQSVGGLDAFDTVHSEICVGGANSFDNNCNAHKNFTRYANGSVNYAEFTNGSQTYDVAVDVDAFDASCGVRLNGTVVDVYGVPIQNAKVEFHILSPSGEPQLYKTIATDENGIYELFGMPAVQYRIFASSGAFQGVVKDIDASAYNFELSTDFTLTQGDCREDCTTSARPGVCIESCNGVNSCAFHNDTVAQRLNGISTGTLRYFSDWDVTINACEGSPVSGDWSNSDVDLTQLECPDGQTAVIITSNVVHQGEVVEMLIQVCE